MTEILMQVILSGFQIFLKNIIEIQRKKKHIINTYYFKIEGQIRRVQENLGHFEI